MQKKIVVFLEKNPVFVLLVPVFFVLHGFLEFFGFIPLTDAVLLALFYCAMALLVYSLLWLCYRRNSHKAALMTAFLFSVYLFFGAYHQFLLKSIPAAGRYSVLLPILGICWLLVFWRIRKGKSFKRVVFFLNLIFLLYIGIDMVRIIVSLVNPPVNKFTITAASSGPVNSQVSQEKPDVYFLIFDEYASSVSLRESYNYKNDLDDYLQQRGFMVQRNSFSNYHYTQPSIASMMNMSFINGLEDSSLLTIKDMNYCMELIKDNEVMKFFSNQQYEIINCSDYNLKNNPAMVAAQVLPAKTFLISENTLWPQIEEDILWNFYIGHRALRWLSYDLYKTRLDNQYLLQVLKDQSLKKRKRPVFVFGHLYMPHDPYYYDKDGRLREEAMLRKDRQHMAQAYLAYLPYVNREIKKLLDTILQNTGKKAVVIVMGDHGFREHIDQDQPRNFQNLNAVFMPSGDFHLFYDSMSSVNQFSVIVNTLFKQSIPLLKDSTIFLKDKN